MAMQRPPTTAGILYAVNSEQHIIGNKIINTEFQRAWLSMILLQADSR
jgi:hypothetical protein